MTDTLNVKPLKVRCPHCGVQTPWQGNADRPFCSPRCRLIDLGQWADEAYRIPTNDAPPEDAEDAHREDEE